MAFVHKVVSSNRSFILKFLRLFSQKNNSCSWGFTFVEVMVTLVILSTGLVVIFKTLFYSLDQIHSLTTRLYADVLIENRISEVERLLRIYNAVPMDLNHSQLMNIGTKEVNFKEQMSFQDVDGLPDVFHFDFSISWDEGNHPMKLNRTTYLLDTNRRLAKEK